MYVFAFLLALLPLFNVVNAETHVILVSGGSSNPSGSDCGPNIVFEYEIARTYHTLIEFGIPANKIIVFMGAEAMNSSECSPFPGHLYDAENKTDYAVGLTIDYTLPDLIDTNFYAVLEGNKSALVGGGSKRVLESGPNDDVFVMHHSHGSDGWLQFGNSGIRHHELNTHLETAKKLNKWRKLVYFADACGAGSAFVDTLVAETGVFAITCDKPKEACGFWCRKVGNYTIGDGCSAGMWWRTYLETHSLEKETMGQQFDAIHLISWNRTRQYGDMDVRYDLGKLFMGINKPKFDFHSSKSGPDAIKLPTSPIAPYVLAQKTLEKNPEMANDKQFMAKLELMEKEKAQMKEMVKSIVKESMKNVEDEKLEKILIEAPEKNKNSFCQNEGLKAAEEKCPSVYRSPFLDDLTLAITNMCNEKVNTQNIVDAINQLCNFKRFYY